MNHSSDVGLLTQLIQRQKYEVNKDFPHAYGTGGGGSCALSFHGGGSENTRAAFARIRGRCWRRVNDSAGEGVW